MEAAVSENEYQNALSRFMMTKGITRCPTACAVPTQAKVAEADRAALREIFQSRDAQRAAAVAQAAQLRAERARADHARA